MPLTIMKISYETGRVLEEPAKPISGADEQPKHRTKNKRTTLQGFRLRTKLVSCLYLLRCSSYLYPELDQQHPLVFSCSLETEHRVQH